ncbi:MAG: type IVB secretion system protein IcmH/DotU [Telluria sp.]
MARHIDRRAPLPAGGAAAAGPTLVDLMTDGLYALFLLREGSAPRDGKTFDGQLLRFLAEFETRARELGIAREDAELARYAYCAVADEIVLRSPFGLRDHWESHPLQLRLFGDQLAGEHFFDKLEQLRAEGSRRLQVLEVFHVCLLLGFQGRYALDGAERLKYLCSRLGEEIALMRGRTRTFAPHAARPDNISHALGADRSLLAMAGLFALAALGAFGVLDYALARQTRSALASYQDVVRMPPQAATVTITLP